MLQRAALEIVDRDHGTILSPFPSNNFGVELLEQREGNTASDFS